MFDARLQPWLRRACDPLGRALVRRGVSADSVTLAGFGVGAGAGAALAAGAFKTGLALILFNRLADGLDGAIARATAPTARGAFLDIGLDFVFYALVPLGFAFADPPRNALPAAVLLATFIGTGSSFLAFAAVAAGRGLKATAFPNKGLYYLGGLTEGGETIAVFVAMCLWPPAFPALAAVFAALCLITTLTRWAWGWRAFASHYDGSNENRS
jgi:phosphatidylglycerophosphate synthase